MKNNVLILAATILILAACGSAHDAEDFVPIAGGGGIPTETAVGDIRAMPMPEVAEEAEITAGWRTYTSWDMDIPAVDEESWYEWEPADMPAPPVDVSHVSGEIEPTVWETPEIPQPAAQRRVIRNSDIAVDTLHFDETVSDLERIVAINGGFIETSAQRVSTRDGRDFWNAEFTIRVPVDRFDHTNQELTELGQTTRFTTNSEDVTMLFLDLQSRLSIREEEERRVEAMRDAAENLQDVLALERQLSDLRVVVDRYRRRMTEIDRLASFSTIRMNVREVEEATEYIAECEEEEEEYIPYVPEDGFGTRITTAFGGSVDFSIRIFEIFAMILVSVLPPLVLLSLPALGVFVLAKKVRERILGNRA